jgi:hypothetical protein
MDFLWTIAKWFCFGVLGLMALGVLLIVVFLLVEAISTARRRKRFREHAAFQTGADGEPVILDTELQARLTAIGAFTMEVPHGCREIFWKSPNGLTCPFAPLELVFNIDPDNIGPDEATFELWDRYRSQHPAHIEDFKKRLIEMYRGLEPNMKPEQALADVRQIWIEVSQQGYGEEATHEMAACFRLAADEEHGYSLAYDSETDRFGDWEE